MSAPESAAKPLLIISAIYFVISVLIPCAFAIFSLHPVALTAEPISVPKNQYIIAITAAIAMTHEIIVRTFLSSITLSENSFANIPLYVEADGETETFGFSRKMCIFIE